MEKEFIKQHIEILENEYQEVSKSLEKKETLKAYQLMLVIHNIVDGYKHLQEIYKR